MLRHLRRWGGSSLGLKLGQKMRACSVFMAMSAVVVAVTAPLPEAQAAQREAKSEAPEMVVAYFSATGQIASLAKEAAELSGADLFRIESLKPYAAAELTTAAHSRLVQEQAQTTLRPAMAHAMEQKAIERYQLLLLGFPLWEDRAPRIVLSFLENHDLQGKSIVPFCTQLSGEVTTAAQLDATLAELKQLTPQAQWADAIGFAVPHNAQERERTQAQMRTWLAAHALLPQAQTQKPNARTPAQNARTPAQNARSSALVSLADRVGKQASAATTYTDATTAADTTATASTAITVAPDSADGSLSKVIPFDLQQHRVTLNSGYTMPIHGIGTYSLHGNECINAVSTALKHGVRLIDTAYMYGNEEEVGAAIKASLVPRKDIFVITKLYPNQFSNPEAAIAQALRKLGLDYIDLMLLHHPGRHDVKAYHAMEKAVAQGKIRSIGLSNWYKEELKDFLPQVHITPALVQNEIHPYYQDREVTDFIQKQGIVVQAWYPLGGRGHTRALLSDPTFVRIAKNHGKSVAQIILRWDLQNGVVVIPGSSNQAHIK